MQQDKTSTHGAFALLAISIIGDNAIIGFPEGTGRDTWISLIIAFFLSLPLVLMYGRMVNLLPGRNIYQMAQFAFGRAGAVIVSFVFGFYCYALTSVMLFNFSSFINMVSLVRSEFYIIVFLFILAGVYLAYQGTTTIGKWSYLIFSTGSVMLILLLFFASDIMNLRNLLPIFRHDFESIFSSGGKIAVLPLLHTVVTLGVSDSFAIKKKGTRLYGMGLLSGVLYLLLVFLRICCTLGAEMMNTVVFQNFRSVSLISISDFFERIEGVVIFLYIMAGIAQLALCILSTANSAKTLFHLPSYKTLLIPISVLIFATALKPFQSIIEMFDFLNVYYYASLPFQIIIPLILWAAIEIKLKKEKRLNPLSRIQEEIDSLEEKTKKLSVKTGLQQDI